MSGFLAKLVVVCVITQLELCWTKAQAARVMPMPNTSRADELTGITRALLSQSGQLCITRVTVQIKSQQGSCMGLETGESNKAAVNWACSPTDIRQTWYWYPDFGVLQNAQGLCLAIYDDQRNSAPYSWDCLLNDPRQKWTVPEINTLGVINSKMGSCVAVYDGNDNSKPYGWECIPSDPRQQWTLSPLGGDSATQRECVNRVKVQIKSQQGSCLGLYTGESNKNAFNWACTTPADVRQTWYWYPDSGSLQNAQGPCLAIYDDHRNSLPYSWECLADDPRQQWTLPEDNSVGVINSKMGSCVAVYDGNDNSTPYGWECIPSDPRQQWTLVPLPGNRR